MTTDDAADVLEATFEAIADRDWNRLSELLVGVRTNPGSHPSADGLRERFQDIELEDYEIEEVEQTTDCRVDTEVRVTRTGYGRTETDRCSLTLFCVDGDGRPDPDGSWTVTNPVVIQSMSAE